MKNPDSETPKVWDFITIWLVQPLNTKSWTYPDDYVGKLKRIADIMWQVLLCWLEVESEKEQQLRTEKAWELNKDYLNLVCKEEWRIRVQMIRVSEEHWNIDQLFYANNQCSSDIIFYRCVTTFTESRFTLTLPNILSLIFPSFKLQK